MRARGVREAVGPLAQERLDQRLGLPVRPRGVGTRVAASDPEGGAGVAPEVRVVGLRVVREHALDHDSLLAIPGDRTLEEGRAVVLAFARSQLAVGQPRVVVDRDVQVLPAGMPGALNAVLQHALADLPEAAELLRVDVQELARPLPLVAHARIAAGTGKARAASSPKHLAHGRRRAPDGGGNDSGPAFR